MEKTRKFFQSLRYAKSAHQSPDKVSRFKRQGAAHVGSAVQVADSTNMIKFACNSWQSDTVLVGVECAMFLSACILVKLHVCKGYVGDHPETPVWRESMLFFVEPTKKCLAECADIFRSHFNKYVFPALCS